VSARGPVHIRQESASVANVIASKYGPKTVWLAVVAKHTITGCESSLELRFSWSLAQLETGPYSNPLACRSRPHIERKTHQCRPVNTIVRVHFVREPNFW
jgi:hypothetical protein